MAKIINRHISAGGMSFLLDNSISLKAKGLLAQVFSVNCQFFTEIESLNPEGVSAIKSLVIELEKSGYLKRHQSNENGFGDVEYHFYNTPLKSDPEKGNR